MDFSESENQSELASLTRKILTQRTMATRAADDASGPDRFDGALWSDLAGAGVLAAALPESVGGAGLGLLDQCSVLIEIGRVVAPVPYLASAVLGAGAIARFGTGAQREKWVLPAGRGDLVLTAALEEEEATHAEPASDGGWRLSGVRTAVPAAPAAALFLVPAATAEGTAVFLVEPGDRGVAVERQELTSGGGAGRLVLDDVRLAADRRLGTPATGGSEPAAGESAASESAAGWLTATATVGLCAHQAGVIARALELTAGYARTREQFGKPIGGFQAVAQRLADAYIDAEAIRLTMWQAAWRLSEGLPAEAEIATAKFWAADAGHRVAHTTVHVHGGVGIDLEGTPHRYFTAAKQNEFTLGGATAQLLRIGAILKDPAA
ncbi:MAG TPA: acyl-CoA dehydrogenase family protein [Trebonia sp.]|nr:acyl-CoA dehydrogenase family protein [Trebonia sp.]